MTRRGLRPALAVTALSLAVPFAAGLGTTSAVALTTSPAAGARPSPWTTLSAGAGINVGFEPGVARWGSKLIVVWPQKSSTGESIYSRVLAANGKPAGPIGTVARWVTVNSDPAVFLLGGVPTVTYSGDRSTESADPYNGPLVHSQSPTADTWMPITASLSHAGAEYGLGAIDDGTGQPLVAFATPSNDRVTFHHGLDTAVPAAADQTTGVTGEVQNVSVARDLKSSAIYALWYAGTSNPALQGIHAAAVYPTLSAPSKPAPMSTVLYAGKKTSVSPGQGVAVAGRTGGGVWAAYGSGYPSAHRLVLWNVQTGRTLTLPRPAGAIQYVGLSAAPGGRLWVFWIEGATVYAVRTNPAVTKFGVVRAVGAPGGYAPTRTAGDGALGPVDVVINQSVNGAPSAISTTRIYEAVTVTTTPATVAPGQSVVVAVSDAGVPVPGAAVTVGGITKRTNAAGRVTFAGGSRGTHPVTATATGFVGGSSSYRVG